jgi:hypothetical protein
MADKRLKELLANPEEKLKATDLVSIRDSWFKQNQLVTGKATENLWFNGTELLLQIQTGKLKKEDAYDLIRKIKE